ncbi:hypothetical protein CFIMG_008523RA00001 [Ceratocystis fimbriata CBS 114723]|uniref:54S ribosomal protein L40, mitochondrial n=1 Tax=Ceratocystis fimbriata CBS 114723 TaxID=1035309 RepID=A0A2C5XJS0_9PEZI|nr:hypothetical protein CFIMG_008523RA00001 [Ceratocystis fimbriata CBS 114723]
MDKVIRRTHLAQRHAMRRRAKKAVVKQAEAIVNTRRQVIDSTRELLNQRKQAVQQSQDLWKKGPLAPNLTAVGSYGIVNQPFRLDNREIAVRSDIVKERCEWAGGVRLLSLALGDRVVIQEGPMKGKIDTIMEISPETGCVRLSNLKYRSRVPDFIEKLYRNETAFNPEMDSNPAIPISAVRLVCPVVMPGSNVPRDVVAEKIVARNIRRDDVTGVTEWDRVIPGLNVIVPWPEKERPNHETNDCDTSREDVFAETFVPTLLRPPMPGQLIDELRGKYSPFRTRHEEWYIAKKNAAEAERKAALAEGPNKTKTADSMLSPAEEASRARKDERRARGQPELSEDMLAKIGEIMAKNQLAMREAAGVEKVESPLASKA